MAFVSYRKFQITDEENHTSEPWLMPTKKTRLKFDWTVNDAFNLLAITNL